MPSSGMRESDCDGFLHIGQMTGSFSFRVHGQHSAVPSARFEDARNSGLPHPPHTRSLTLQVLQRAGTSPLKDRIDFLQPSHATV